jgi:hypothetical protein
MSPQSSTSSRALARWPAFNFEPSLSLIVKQLHKDEVRQCSQSHLLVKHGYVVNVSTVINVVKNPRSLARVSAVANCPSN